MGQSIAIASTTVDGRVAAFHTDRGITGQDGASFADAEQASAAGSFPGELANRLFASDPSVDHVFVASNQVVVRRDADWDDSALAAAASIVTQFFVFYPAT
jgi:hypothetical protein